MAFNPDEHVYFRNILVAVDDSPDAILAFKYAIHRAKKDNVKLTITSILENEHMSIYDALNKDYIHGKREDLVKHLADYKTTAEKAGVKNVATVIAEGDNAGEAIVEQVIPHVQADLLIVGSKSTSGIAKRFGSQAAYMAKYAPISVLVIR